MEVFWMDIERFSMLVTKKSLKLRYIVKKLREGEIT